jgi:hypothetical protein
MGEIKQKGQNTKVYDLWFYCSQIVSILFRSFGFIAPRFCLSCLSPLVYCSQILSILFRPFGFIVPRFCLSCLDLLVLLLPDFVSPVYDLWFYCSQILSILFRPFGFIVPSKTKGLKQDRQNLGAIKPKVINRIDKIWEQ